jgi:hypothetical protein
MQKILGADKPHKAIDILRDLAAALEIDGTLEITKRDYIRDDGTPGTAWDWVRRRPSA